MKYRNIILLVVAISLVACGGPEERKSKYLAQAQDYLEADNYPKARVTEQVLLTADKVLAKDPHHPQANALKIAVLAVEGHLPDAITKAEALRSQFPTEPDVAILLATLQSQQQ